MFRIYICNYRICEWNFQEKMAKELKDPNLEPSQRIELFKDAGPAMNKLRQRHRCRSARRFAQLGRLLAASGDFSGIARDRFPGVPRASGGLWGPLGDFWGTCGADTRT